MRWSANGRSGAASGSWRCSQPEQRGGALVDDLRGGLDVVCARRCVLG
jgi:hypothetical protein